MEPLTPEEFEACGGLAVVDELVAGFTRLINLSDARGIMVNPVELAMLIYAYEQESP